MFDQPSYLNQFQNIIRRFVVWPWARFLGVLAVAVGILLSGFGVWLGLQSGQTVALATTQASTDCHTPTNSSITIDVSGAVLRPGVYQLPDGSRGSDAVAAAGGFSDQADSQSIATDVNLAQELTDGAKLYLPYLVEESVTQADKSMVERLVSINTASATELDTLPGIGQKRAADIVANRPYGSLEELLTRVGLSETVFSDIYDQISL